MSREDASNKYQELSEAWNVTVDSIRLLDNHRTFLHPTPFEKLREAAEESSVVIVNISDQGFTAIIMYESRNPFCVPLPEVTPTTIEALVCTLENIITDFPEESERDQTLAAIL
ncbi:hypothetical protein FRB97_005551 [Tulasnella sp. 331]|nr:hypothetical protein FRB97_005551 [Tulasnella sp. 331]